MDKLNVFNIARKLAKQLEYQMIYNQEKLQFKIFKNDIDLTNLQIIFLEYLGFYNSLYTDLALGEITEKTFENEIYEDAYSFYKRNSKEHKKVEKIQDKPKEKQIKSRTQWVFK